MGESLNQPSSVKEDCPTGCKLLLSRNKKALAQGSCRYWLNKDRLIPCQQPR